jgi:hypothetical protein
MAVVGTDPPRSADRRGREGVRPLTHRCSPGVARRPPETWGGQRGFGGCLRGSRRLGECSIPGVAPANRAAGLRFYTRGTLTTEYVVVGVGGVLNRALIA